MCGGGGGGVGSSGNRTGGGDGGYYGQGAAANSGGSMMGGGYAGGGYSTHGNGEGRAHSDGGMPTGGVSFDGQKAVEGAVAGGAAAGLPGAVVGGVVNGFSYSAPTGYGLNNYGYSNANNPGKSGNGAAAGRGGNSEGGGADPRRGQIAQAVSELPAKTPEQIAAEKMQAMIDKINGAFGADLSGMRSDIYNFHLNDLDKQKEQAERALRFQLARMGQMGGSVDVDENARMASDYLTGSNKIGLLADSSVNSAKTAIDNQRLALVNGVRSGQDVSTQLAEAGNTISRNINAAKDAATGTALGRAFNVLGTQYDNAQTQAGVNSVLLPNKKQGGLFFSNPGSNGQITGS